MLKQSEKRGGKRRTEYRFRSANDIMDYEENVKRLNRGEPLKFGSDSKS